MDNIKHNRVIQGKIVVTIFIIMSLITISSCREKEDEVFKVFPLSVKAGKVTRKKIAPEISSFGTVLYYSKADVYPTTEGYIDTVEAAEGDEVCKGQLLARLRQEKLFIEKEKSVSDVNSKKSLLRLSEEKLLSGKKEAEKKIISINGALKSLKQKKLELENIKRIYRNKQALFDAGGLSREELESVKMSYLKSEYEYEKSLNDLELIKTGYRECDIQERGYEVPEDERERNRLLVKINTSILEAEKEVAISELMSSEAELERINLLIKETEICSPISGIVGKKNFDIGEKVKPDSNMFTVFRSSRVYAVFEAGENLSTEIEKGMRAIVSAGGKSEAGEVSIISPVINPGTRTREIKIILDNRNGSFIPGSFARITVKTGKERDRLVVPESALLENKDECKSGVFILRDNAAFRKEVKVLYKTDESAVLAEGELEEGELVCLDPPVSLSDGREVRIIQ